MKKDGDAGKELERLIGIIARLREPGGCPWDRKQTIRTLTDYLLEEVYEAVEACLAGDATAAEEELGDVFMEIVFLCRLFEEKGAFAAAAALAGINTKMIDRHPHVFAGEKVSGSDQVVEEWNRRKLEEKGRSSVLDGVGGNLPALLEAFELGRKAASVGFDWPDTDGVLKKLQEEIGELENARGQGDAGKVEEEMGDIFFTLVNLSRFLSIDAEKAATGAIDKFLRRFAYITAGLAARGQSLQNATPGDMDALWNEAKEKRI